MTKPPSPVGGIASAVTRSTTASAGARSRRAVTNSPTAPDAPSASAKTPSTSLPTKPATPSSAASACTNGRYPTPWTTPSTRTRTRARACSPVSRVPAASVPTTRGTSWSAFPGCGARRVTVRRTGARWCPRPPSGHRRSRQTRQVAPIEAHVAAVQPTEVATGEIRVGPVALAYIDPGQFGADLDVTAGVHAFPAGAGLQPGRRRVQLGGEVWRVGCPLPPLRGPGHAADAVRSRGEGRASLIRQPPATSVAAVWADEAVRPAQPLQVVQAVGVSPEPGLELAHGSRVVHADAGAVHRPLA